MDIQTYPWYNKTCMMCVYNWTKPEGRFGLFAHYTISLSLLCRLVWQRWVYKTRVMHILSQANRGLKTYYTNLKIAQQDGMPFYSAYEKLEDSSLKDLWLASVTSHSKTFFSHALEIATVLHINKTNKNIFIYIFTVSVLPVFLKF